MSLAFNAASFEDSNEDLIQKKRQAHNKTQKQYPKDKFDAEKVNSLLHQMQKQDSGKYNDGSGKYNNDAGSELGDFTPQPQQMLSPPQSAGVARTLKNLNDDDLDTNNLDQNYGNAEEYYKRVLGSSGASTNAYPNNHNDKSDALMQKINYMINLLEEQQDERTNNVTEEVVLYSFLGIFVIFVVDSFVKVGKYVR